MKEMIKIRLEIIRSIRATKLTAIDDNIRIFEDSGEETLSLREQRQRLRDITEPIKALLEQEESEYDTSLPILQHSWDAFSDVNWN